MNAYLLGMIMVGKILDAALARSEMDEKDRKDFTSTSTSFELPHRLH